MDAELLKTLTDDELNRSVIEPDIKIQNMIDNMEIVDILIDNMKNILAKRDSFKSEVEGKFEIQLWNELFELGIFSVTMPEEHGGMGIDPWNLGVLLKSCAMEDISLGIALMEHSLAVLLITMSEDSNEKSELLKFIVDEKIFLSASKFLQFSCKASVAPNDYISLIINNYGIKSMILCPEAVNDGKMTRYHYCLLLDNADNEEELSETRSLGPRNLKYIKSASCKKELKNTENNKKTLKVFDKLKASYNYINACIAVMIGSYQCSAAKYSYWSENRILFGVSLEGNSIIQLRNIDNYGSYIALNGIWLTLILESEAVSPDLHLFLLEVAARINFDVIDATLELYGGTGYFEETGISTLFRCARVLQLNSAEKPLDIYRLAEKAGELISFLTSEYENKDVLDSFNDRVCNSLEVIGSDALLCEEISLQYEKIIKYVFIVIYNRFVSRCRAECEKYEKYLNIERHFWSSIKTEIASYEQYVINR